MTIWSAYMLQVTYMQYICYMHTCHFVCILWPFGLHTIYDLLVCVHYNILSDAAFTYSPKSTLLLIYSKRVWIPRMSRAVRQDPSTATSTRGWAHAFGNNSKMTTWIGPSTKALRFWAPMSFPTVIANCLAFIGRVNDIIAAELTVSNARLRVNMFHSELMFYFKESYFSCILYFCIPNQSEFCKHYTIIFMWQQC